MGAPVGLQAASWKVSGWVVLLLLAFAVGSTVLSWHTFTDEADKLAGGFLISQGYVLYRDLFSHHFPFAYYWLALVFSIFPASVLVARLSVLWFQLITFSLLMRYTRRYIAVGAAAVTWNTGAYIYFGHMALYQTFAGPGSVVI